MTIVDRLVALMDERNLKPAQIISRLHCAWCGFQRPECG